MPVAKVKTTRSKKRWVIAAIVVLVLAAAAIYYFFFRPQPGPNVSLEFKKPDVILLGDPFSINVSASNYSDVVLKDSKLSISLPDGVSFTGQSSDQRILEQAVGDLGPGSVSEQKFNLIVSSGAQSVKHVEAKFVYSGATDSKAQYETDSALDFIVGQPAVSLTINMPQSVFSDNDFNITVNYTNNASHDFQNVHLKLDYPPAFQFKMSTVAAETSGNNSWNLGTLSGGSQGTIAIKGNMVGQGNSSFGLVGIVTADFLGTTYTINTQTANITIAQPPLSLDISVNGGTNYIASSGDTLNYVLSYKNNYDVTLNNVTIQARLVGEMFDFTTFESDGTFNSLSNTVTWLTANTPSLSSLAPGESGMVTFSIHLRESYPIRLLSDKNFTVKIQAQIQSPTVPPLTTAQRTLSLANLETKVAGELSIAAKALWRDAASVILNSGPYPPHVNKPTQYTVHWLVTNYSTDVSTVKVSAFLQSGTRFTGVVKSNTQSMPTYDPSTGLVSWIVDFLPATKGVISPPAEAIFQVENTPNVNQVGQFVTLIGQTDIEGVDNFTSSTLKSSAAALDTSLPYDTTINTYNRQVQP